LRIIDGPGRSRTSSCLSFGRTIAEAVGPA